MGVVYSDLTARSSIVVTGGTDGEIALALTFVDVSSEVDLRYATDIDVKRDLRVSAVNHNSFEVKTTAATQAGYAGIAANFLDVNSKAEAIFGGYVEGLDNVVVEALDFTSKNYVLAEAKAGTTGAVIKYSSKAADKVQDYISIKMGQQQEKDLKSGTAVKPKLAGAVTIVNTNNSAIAKATFGANVKANNGITIAARVIDGGVANHAISNVVSTARDKAKPDEPNASIAISAAVAYGDYNRTALAYTEHSPFLEAARVGINAQVIQPYQFGWHKYEGFSSITNKLSNLKTDLGLHKELIGYANSKGKSENLSIVGSVSLLYFTNNAHAYTSGRTIINIKGYPLNEEWIPTNLPGQALIDQQYGEKYGVGCFRPVMDAPVTIKAVTDITGVFGAGNIDSWYSPAGSGSEAGASVGGVYNHPVYINNTLATVGEGARITAADILFFDAAVVAETNERMLVITPTAGSGGSYGINGMVALSGIYSNTIASIDDEATITAQNLLVNATDNVLIWSIGGAVNKSEALGVGVGIAINDVMTNTLAFIGDNDDPGSTDNYDGLISVRSNLDVSARTDGSINALSVVGSMASSDDPDAEPGFMDKLKAGVKDKLVALKNKIVTPGGKIQKGITKINDLVKKVQDKIKSASGDDGGGGLDPTQKEDPKFGIGLSGSASVNLTQLDTTAYIDSAIVQFPEEFDSSSLRVSAVNDTDIFALSGGAALAKAKNPSSQFSGAVAGAVTVNILKNSTTAYIKNADITAARDVAVYALAGGDQVSVALGLSVNTETEDKNASMAGSVSVSLSENSTSAGVEQTNIVGDSDKAETLSVIAYDRTYLGTGGGTFAYGGKGGIGLGVTYSEISNATKANVIKSIIRDFNTIQVHGLSASQIIAGAAAASLIATKESGTLTGAVVINLLRNETAAEIAESVILDADHVNVLARDGFGMEGIGLLDQLIDEKDPEREDDSIYSYDGTALFSDGTYTVQEGDTLEALAEKFELDVEELAAANGISPDAELAAGQSLTIPVENPHSNRISIFAGAGVAQGSGNNVGLSFTWNDIANSYKAEIRDSDITTTSSGNVSAQAISSSAITGFSVGVGAAGEFGGAGSVTVNDIANEITARISGGSVSADNVVLHASDQSWIGSLAGQVTISIGNASIGAAVSVNNIGNKVQSGVYGSEITTKNISINGLISSSIYTLAVAGGGSAGFAINGSFAVADIYNSAKAETAGLDDTASIITGDTLNIEAGDDSKIYSGSGSATFSSNAAIGGALTVNTINNDVISNIAHSDLTVANLLVNSLNSGKIRTVAIAGGGTGGVSVTGSFTFAYIGNTTEAAVRSSNIEAALAGIIAEEKANIASISGAAGYGGQAAVGGAITVNIISNTTRSLIEGGKFIVNNTLSVKSLNESLINTLAAAGQASGQAAIAGSTVDSVIANSTVAQINGLLTWDGYAGFEITAGMIEVSAEDKTQIHSVSGQVAGAGSAAVGAGVNVNVVKNTTLAQINDRLYRVREGDSLSSIANRFGVQVAQLEVVNKLAPGAAIKEGQELIIPSSNAGWKSSLTGETLVSAVNSSQIRTIALGFAGAAYVGGELIVATSHIENQTHAGITGVTISNHDQAVEVLAMNIGEISSLSGEAVGSGAVSLGAATSVNRIANQTRAYVRGGGTASNYNLGNLLVRSYNRTAINNAAIGVAAAAGEFVAVGLAGSVATNFINNTTESYIDSGAKVIARNNVGVFADNHDVINNAAGALGLGIALGGVGASGSVTVNEIGGETKAYISGIDTAVSALRKM